MEENSKNQEKETAKVENTNVKEVETAKNEKVETKKLETEKAKNVEAKETKSAKSEKNETKTNVTDKKENTKKEVSKNDGKFKKKVEKEKASKKSKGPLVFGIIGIIVIAVIVSALVFLQASPARALDEMFSSLKQGDFAKVNEYVNLQELMEDANFEEDSEEDREKEKLFFNKLEWKINKVNEEKDKATAEVEVTNKDFKIIITNYMQKILKIAFGGEDISEQEMETYLLDLLKDENSQTVTNTKTVELVKQDGKWRVVANSELTSIILPGLEDAINSLNEVTE